MSSNLAELLTTPSLEQVRALVNDDFAHVDRLIRSELRSDVELVQAIASYIVDSGGKRLRPLVVLLTARACGYEGVDHQKLAALVEFLHTATLLHDDVVDESFRRRGRDTVNALWGNAPSVLVGDFLYSRAFQLMIQINMMDLLKIISDATVLIAEGEVLQLQKIGNTSLSEEDYVEIIRRKTAMLFQAAAHTGACIAGVDLSIQNSLREFGLHFGLAFQLIDDWLDYAGDSNAMGKNVGDDLAEGKATLPLIYAMRYGSNRGVAVVQDAITSKSDENLDEVIEAVHSSGALDYTRNRAENHTKICIESLAPLPPSEFRSGLEALANIAVCRMT